MCIHKRSDQANVSAYDLFLSPNDDHTLEPNFSVSLKIACFRITLSVFNVQLPSS